MNAAATDRPEPPLYNPLDPEVHHDPYPHYRELRERDPVHQSPVGSWFLFRYDDILAAQRDPRLIHGFLENASFVEARGGPKSPMVAAASRWMLFRDGTDHRRLRGLVSKVFTARAVEGLHGRIQQIVDDLIERAEQRGSFDAVGDFAFPLPVIVICELLGFPAKDRDLCREWAEPIGLFLDPIQSEAKVRRMNAALSAFHDYVEEQIGEKRRKPRHDLLSALMEVEEAGERLSHEDLVDMVILLFAAGHETTRNLIGNGLLALLQHPDELRRLRAELVLMDDAVEEMLRYDSPVQLHGRRTVTATEIAGRLIPAHTGIVLVVAAGNRDPSRFENPDHFDVGRTDIEPLSFGGGSHYCIGAMLARLEAKVAIGTLIRRFPKLELGSGELRWREHISLRGLEALPIQIA